MMPAISDARKIMKKLVVLPIVDSKYHKRPNDKYGTASNFLPKPNYLHIQSVAGVDTKFFFSWSQEFVKETEPLQSEG